IPAYHSSHDGAAAWDFLTKVNGIPVIQNPPLFSGNMIAVVGNGTDYAHRSPESSYKDTLSWTRGAHAIKTGVEFRFANSLTEDPSGGVTGGDLIPFVVGGAGDRPVTGIDRVPGMLPPNISLAQDLLLSLSGSVDSVIEKFETREPTDKQFRSFSD